MSHSVPSGQKIATHNNWQASSRDSAYRKLHHAKCHQKPNLKYPQMYSCSTPLGLASYIWYLLAYGGDPPLHTIDDATNLGGSLTRSTRKIIFVLSTHQPHMLLVPTAAAATGPCCTYPCGGQSSYNQSNNNYRVPQLVRQNQIRRCEHERHMEHNLRRMTVKEAI